MSDNRPSVYVEDGVAVYRASDVGNCLRALVAMGRDGYDAVRKQEHTDLLERSADEGDLHEEGVRQKLVREGWKVVSTQQEINVPVIPGVVVRGHTDGILAPPDPSLFYRQNVLLEVKSMSNKRFARWTKGGFDEFHKFAYQISIYMEANPGLPVLYVVKRREDGLEDRMTIPPYNPPIPFKEVKKRILKAESWRRKRAGFPECDLTGSDKFFCPFFYLHDEEDPNEDLKEATPEEIAVLTDLLPKRAELKAIEDAGKEAEKLRKDLDKELLNLMGATKQIKGVIIDGLDHQITRVDSSNSSLDVEKLRVALGEDFESFYKRTYFSYPKVTAKKNSPKPTMGKKKGTEGTT